MSSIDKMVHLIEGRWTEMDARVMAIRMEKWREIIVACNTSGMKKKEWMRIHNINSKTFYRKQKELRDYEMKKAGITPANTSAGQSPTGFFDLTAALSRQTKEISTPTGKRYDNCALQTNQPELMIQVGAYNLYIGRDVSEATLTTVLQVINHA